MHTQITIVPSVSFTYDGIAISILKIFESKIEYRDKLIEKFITIIYSENGNLTIHGYAYRAGFSSVQFDGQGNLENGKAIEQALIDKVNDAIDNYNEHRNDDDAS
jgi:hypothetical protein